MPSFFESDDYRLVLRRHLRAAEKRLGRGQTSRLARIAGVTAGQVRNIVMGRRKLQVELLDGFVRGMGLTDEEAEYFRALVRACHGPTAAEREAATLLVKEIRARHGFPRRKRGRPLRSARPDVEAQTQIEARALALLLRPWVRFGAPLFPFMVATLLDGVVHEAQLRRVLEAFPTLAELPRGDDQAPELWPEDDLESAAMGLVLRATRARIGGLTPPDRSLNTNHALLRVADLPTLIEGLDEAWVQAVKDARALARRAAEPIEGEPVHIHQLTLALWPQHSPFHTEVPVDWNCSSVPSVADPPPCAPRNPTLPSGAAMPSPFDFLELLPYLKAWHAHKKAANPRYSLTTFARLAESSTSHVHNVFRGERPLKDGKLPGFVRGLGLFGHDATYLGLLASLDDCAVVGHRALLLRQMSNLHMQRAAPMPQGLVFSTLVEPRNLVLYEAAGAPGFRADPAWVAVALGWELAPAREALDALRRAGLLVPTGDGGVLRPPIDFALPSHLSGPPVEHSQLSFLDRSLGAVAAGVRDRVGRALGLLLRREDREALRQVADSLYLRIHKVIEGLGAAAHRGPGPYVVYTLQVTASPVSRALKPRPT